MPAPVGVDDHRHLEPPAVPQQRHTHPTGTTPQPSSALAREAATPPTAEPGLSPAYVALARLGREDHRLALSADDCAALEPRAAEWLARGVSVDYLTTALTAGLPAEINSPVGFLRRRLTTKLPRTCPQRPPPAHPTTPAARVLVECTECGTPGRPRPSPTASAAPAAKPATPAPRTPHLPCPHHRTSRPTWPTSATSSSPSEPDGTLFRGTGVGLGHRGAESLPAGDQHGGTYVRFSRSRQKQHPGRINPQVTNVVPARAGVVPTLPSTGSLRLCGPRARGGGPYRFAGLDPLTVWSPRTRGPTRSGFPSLPASAGFAVAGPSPSASRR